jgi:predicted unusual protein kinase regulating ubiquinone biosynthesis (AarF/ABC1/UbiB family)
MKDQGKDRDEEDGSGAPPGGATQRGLIAAKTSLKIGSNYARYLSRRATGTDKEEARSELNTRNAEDLFSELSKLRGTALKMAQALSMEPGLLPDQFHQILSKAQYEVPAMGPALVRRLVTQALGMSPEKAFAEFCSAALAAASLGQVHRARMHDGRDVVVKVQYPNVRESIDSDLRMVRGLAGRFVSAKAIDPFLTEVRDRMMEETDYLQEGQNMEAFAGYFDSSQIVVPRWIKEQTTERVLTMTFVEGIHLKEYLATNPSQEDRDRYGQLLWDTVHSQIVADHLTVHADAHPGNFMFRTDGRLAILDFGCVKHFPREFRDSLLELFQARMSEDQARQERVYSALGMLPADLKESERAYLMEVIGVLGNIVASLYENDIYDFGSGELFDRFKEVMPKFMSREAYKPPSHRITPFRLCKQAFKRSIIHFISTSGTCRYTIFPQMP